MPPIITKRPTRFELFILKWIALPLMAILLLYVFSGVTARARHCKQLCEEKGFFAHSYVPSSKGRGESCYCITEAESKAKNRIPAGVKVF